MSSQPSPQSSLPSEKLESVVVRFAGDSGDGVQLTGTQFTRTSAMLGNDIATFPDFPAEIRAPAGTLFGVSGFQIQFGSVNIRTPGDQSEPSGPHPQVFSELLENVLEKSTTFLLLFLLRFTIFLLLLTTCLQLFNTFNNVFTNKH